MILKAKSFGTIDALIQYVNDNEIAQEQVVSITQSHSAATIVSYAVFYYADLKTKEKTRNFWGNLKEKEEE